MTNSNVEIATRSRWNVAAVAVGVFFLAGSLVVVLDPPGGNTGALTSLDRVVTDLEQRVKGDPQSVDARLAVAIAYTERGMNRDAVAQFEQALILSPDNQTALIGLGRSYVALGDHASATKSLERVADLNANNPRRYAIEQLGGVYFDLGRIALDQGEPTRARQWFAEALQVSRTDADALRFLGLAHDRLGEPKEAEKALFAAVRVVPDYREAYEALESIYVRTGDQARLSYARGMLKLADKAPAEAVSLLERAVAGTPDLPQPYEGLGVAYEGVGRRDDALTAYRRALQLDPEMFLSGLAVDRLTSSTSSGR
jgi:tetratricopeptide (TPR) repeat protein